MVVDFILLVILLFFLIYGLKKGFIGGLANILGIIIGLKIAFKYGAYFVNRFQPYFHSELLTKVLVYFSVIILSIFLIKTLGLIVTKIIEMLHLGWLNTIVGGFFGILKGIILIWFALFITINIFPHTKTLIKSSLFSRQILNYGDSISPILEKIGLEKKSLTNVPKLLSFIRNALENDCHKE